MKKEIIITCFTMIVSNLFFISCEVNGTYEVDDNLVPISANISYLENNAARYRIDFGSVRLSDSLPYLSQDAGIYNLTRTSKGVYIKQKKLSQDLKIWRLGANGSQILESTMMVNAPAEGGVISLLQLSDKSPLNYFNPVLPQNERTTQTIQLFYTDASQSNDVNVTILAVEYITFLTTGQNFNNLAIDKKKELATFALQKGLLSESVTLDLNLFKQINKVPTAFFYKITDAKTGTILQNYNKSYKLDPIVDANNKLNPVYKCSLFRLKYNTINAPFKAENLINRYEW
jgi:hypothetical protein